MGLFFEHLHTSHLKSGEEDNFQFPSSALSTRLTTSSSFIVQTRWDREEKVANDVKRISVSTVYRPGLYRPPYKFASCKLLLLGLLLKKCLLHLCHSSGQCQTLLLFSTHNKWVLNPTTTIRYTSGISFACSLYAVLGWNWASHHAVVSLPSHFSLWEFLCVYG